MNGSMMLRGLLATVRCLFCSLTVDAGSIGIQMSLQHLFYRFICRNGRCPKPEEQKGGVSAGRIVGLSQEKHGQTPPLPAKTEECPCTRFLLHGGTAGFQSSRVKKQNDAHLPGHNLTTPP